VRWIALGALAVIVALAVVLATRPPSQATPVDSPLVGHRAPAFDRTVLSPGHGRLALRSLHGHWVVLNFFASWCAPCQTEEPDLVAFAYQQRRVADGARLVSVVFQDSDAAAQGFERAQGATTWPTVSDPGGQVANSYGVSAPPTAFLIDPTGRVVAEWVAPLTLSQLDQGLRQERHVESPGPP
jgi:cytochrome c biogenesis protein CcmG/thiol:disulfide interchange protein DsbE